jgi:hypothetical protein
MRDLPLDQPEEGDERGAVAVRHTEEGHPDR